MVSSKAKTVSIVFRAELIAVDEPSGDSFAKTRPARDSQRAGSRKHLLRFHLCLRSAILAARHAALDSLRIVSAVRSVVFAISLVPCVRVCPNSLVWSAST
jgi:hypothetical protein